MSLSVKTLMELGGTKNTYQKGADYCRNNRANVKKMPDGEIVGMVSGSEGNQYMVRLRYTQDQTNLEHYQCECPAFHTYGGICKHIIAVVLQYQKSMTQQQPFSHPSMVHTGTQRSAQAMIERYVQQVVIEHGAGQGQTHLEVILEPERNSVRLSFKLGIERMYVVSNLPKFYNQFAAQETAAYGKNYSLCHHPASFHEDSQPLLEFFLHYYNEADQITLSSQRFYGYGSARRYMYLRPHMLDALLALGEQRAIKLSVQEESWPLVLSRQDYRIALCLYREEHHCALKLMDSIHLLAGERHMGILAHKILHVCSAAYCTACRDLLQTLLGNRGQLLFDRKDVPVLFSTVLNQAAPFIDLEIEEGLAPFVPPKLETKLYLDAHNEDCISAHMTFSYADETHPAFVEKNLRTAYDLAGELAAESLLKQYLGDQVDEQGNLLLQSDPDAVYRLVSEGISALAQHAEIYASDSFRNLRVHPTTAVRVGVRVESNLLQIDFDLQGLDLTELSDVLTSYRQAKKYHRLRDGSFLMLEEGGLSHLAQLADDLDLTDQQLQSGHAELPLNRALYLDALIKQSEEIRYDRDKAFKSIVRGMRDVTDADFVVPDALRSVLRNYQKTGYRWLRTIDAFGFGGILADDMGLGKTLQVLTLLRACYQQGERVPPSIVISPASLLWNWESEATRFAPDLRVAVVTGTAQERAEKIAQAGNFDCLITSYDLLKRDVEQYMALQFWYIVIDEAQYIKNPGTQNAKSVKLLHGKTRLALTGTPMENSLAELWSIFDFLMPGYLLAYHKFKARYEGPIVREQDAAATGRLRQLVRPFMLRRLKSEVLSELPPKTETVLYITMEAAQQKLYLATLLKAKQELAALDLGQGRFAVLAALTRMRQICCDPALLFEEYKGGSIKLEACLELIQSCIASGRRMLLFSQFTSMLSILAERLDQLGIAYLRLEGATKSARRMELVNEFNSGSVSIFLISLKAGGTGLNLTGADVVIHYDPWWNLSAQNQATDRAHRIGQKNNVQVYKLIVKDTVEERILKMQQDKAALVDRIVQEEADVFVHMSQEELLSLFEG